MSHSPSWNSYFSPSMRSAEKVRSSRLVTKTDVFIRFRWSSVDGGKHCESANVDVNTFMRFQETENGGFRKRISVDGA